MDVQLDIKNQTTNQLGHNVSATTEQKVKFTITVKNLSKKKSTATVMLTATVPSIPGCTVSEARTIELSPSETKKEWGASRLPRDALRVCGPRL